jgi:hypothetical protein
MYLNKIRRLLHGKDPEVTTCTRSWTRSGGCYLDMKQRLLPGQDPDCCRRVQKVEAEGEEGTLAAVAEGSAVPQHTLSQDILKS